MHASLQGPENPAPRRSFDNVKTRTIARAIETACASFDREIAQIADQARDQLIPYFQKRGWSYETGNGAWLIKDRHGHRINNGALPAHVRYVLCLEAGCGQRLGLLIQDI